MQFTPVRTAIILVVALLGLLFAIPNFLSKDQLASWPDFLPKQPLVLGLDLTTQEKNDLRAFLFAL